MEIGYVGKGKGKKGKLSNSSRAKLAMLKRLRKGKGKNPHWNCHTKAKGTVRVLETLLEKEKAKELRFKAKGT